MNNIDGSTYWGLGLDNSQLKAAASESKNAFREIGDTAVAEGARIDNAWGKAGMAITGVLSFTTARSFVANMIKVRSEFENTEASFEVFLKSGKAAKKFMEDLQDYAFNNVFEFSDLTKEAANLLAFRTEVSEVIPVLDRLSNIAAGANKPLSELVSLYNKAKSGNRLQAMDIQSWGQKGVNIAYELAEAMGVTEQAIASMVSSGEIKFSHLQMVIQRLTDEGGQFAGMMEKKMLTLGDSIGLLQDNITNMYNELGQANRGILKEGIDFAGTMVENYETVGKCVGQLIALYGSYKAAVITTIALKKAERAVTFVKEYTQMGRALGYATANHIAFNTVAKISPYAWVGIAIGLIAGLASAIYLWKNRTEEVSEAQEALNRVNERTNELIDEEESKINRLIDTLHNSNMAEIERLRALKELKDIIPDYNAEIGAEGQIINENTTAIKNYLTQLERQIKMKAAQEELEGQYRNKRTLEKQLKAEQEELNRAKGKKNAAQFAQYGANQKFSTSGMQTLSQGTNIALQNAQADVNAAQQKVAETEAAISGCLEAITELNEEIASTSLSAAGTEPELKNFNEQLANAATRVKTLKAELAALLRGEGQEEDFAEAIKKKRSEIKDAEEAYNLLLGKTGKEKTSSSKKTDYTDRLTREARDRERMIVDLEHAVRQAEIDAMEKGLEKTMAQNELNYRKELEQINRQKEDKLALVQQWEKTIWENMNPEWEEKGMKFTPGDDINTILETIGKKMADAFGSGNVDLLARPLIDAAELAKKGWEDAGEGIATVFSSQYGVEDPDGNVIEILVTPILPNGDVLSPEELEDYVDSVLDGAQDILAADTKGIVISIGVDSDGKGGDLLHQMQEEYYELKKLTEQPLIIRQQSEVLQESAGTRFTTNNKKAYESELNDYADFAQKYLRKAKEFENNIKNLTDKGADTETIAGVKAMQDEMLASLDEEMEVKNQAFVSFVESMVEMGLSELLEALETAKTALDAEIVDGGGDKEKVTQLKAQVKTLTARIEELSSIKKETKSFNDVDPSKKWRSTLKIMNDVKNITNDIVSGFDGLSDATKVVLDSAINIATGVTNMIIGINTLAIGSAAATTATATTATTAIKGVEKASVILAIISAALQIAQGIANLVTNLFSGDKKKEKEIKKLQEQVDGLEAAYNKLGKSIEKAYSTDASKLIAQQEANLRQQKVLIQQQIREEQSKKKTDNDKIKDWKNAIAEIDNALAEIKDRQIEAIIGTDIKAAIDEFANAYIDAWAAGEDRAASMKDVVRKMVKSAVTELVKSRLSPEVQNFMNFLAQAMEDGVLTAAEQQALDEWEKRLYDKASQIDENFGKYILDKTDDEDDRSPSKRGFEAMNQETANELNGRFTAMQTHTYSLSEDVREMKPSIIQTSANVASMKACIDVLRSNAGEILQTLNGIKGDTAHLEDMKKDMKTVKQTIEDLNTRGIIIRR